MTWRPEVEEIERRHKLAEKMGGEEGVERQHRRGKLTVRERLEGLVDPGSFQQSGKLMGGATYDGAELVDFTPHNKVSGICTLNGRRVYLTASDFTVRGGASETVGGPGVGVGQPEPLEWKMPSVNLLDATGGSVATFEKMGRTYIPDGPFWGPASQLLGVAPVVMGVMGSVAGGAAVMACISHFSVMVKDTSQIFPGGPPVVKAALGYDITKEDLGDYRIHTQVSGVVDNLANTEEEAFEMIRRFLSYLPDNVWEMPPRTEPTDDPNRRDEELLDIIPKSKRRKYDAHELLGRIVDHDSIFEISPDYGQSRITALARVNGYPIGIMVNNPKHLGGAMDVTAGDKVIRFLQLCDTFHLPMVFLCDEPGFMVGVESEKRGIERAGARIVCATCETSMPWITFITRQSFGVAGSLQYRPGGMFRRYAWPSGIWGSMHIEGGTTAAYRRIIDSSDDPEAKRIEIEDRLKALASPFRTAEATGLDIIDPRETRPILCDFVEMAQSVIKTQLGPKAGPSYRP